MTPSRRRHSRLERMGRCSVRIRGPKRQSWPRVRTPLSQVARGRRQKLSTVRNSDDRHYAGRTHFAQAFVDQQSADGAGPLTDSPFRAYHRSRAVSARIGGLREGAGAVKA